tara:strand:- start:61918 stop:63036 length:1119 start_codon:yes stop_codon:yes gene_type:complete
MFDKKKAAKAKKAPVAAIEAAEDNDVAVVEKPEDKGRPVANMEDLLLGSVENSAGEMLDVPPEDQVLKLRTEHFYADDQVRKTFDEHEIEEMAASLRTNKQIQPIVVHPADENGRYKIDKGECRWRASQLIDGFVLKAIIDPEAPNRGKKKRIITQFVENDQRNDLPPKDQADALKELIDEGMTMEEIALEIGWLIRGTKKPNINKVSRTLSILKLPEEGQQLVKDGVIKDLITLEFLRKIFEISADKFSVVCDLAKEEGGLTRKRAEQEYKRCKSNEEGGAATSPKAPAKKPAKGSESSPQQPGSEQQTEPSSTGSSSTPTIRVEWRGMQTGVLVLDELPDNEGEGYMIMDSGDKILVELSEVVIKEIELK